MADKKHKAERFCTTHRVVLKNKIAEMRHKRANKGCHIGWRLEK